MEEIFNLPCEDVYNDTRIRWAWKYFLYRQLTVFYSKMLENYSNLKWCVRGGAGTPASPLTWQFTSDLGSIYCQMLRTWNGSMFSQGTCSSLLKISPLIRFFLMNPLPKLLNGRHALALSATALGYIYASPQFSQRLSIPALSGSFTRRLRLLVDKEWRRLCGTKILQLGN